MDFLPRNCRNCHQGTYTYRKFLEDKAHKYLKDLGKEQPPGITHNSFCLSALMEATRRKQDTEQFFETVYIDCTYRNECNLGKIL